MSNIIEYTIKLNDQAWGSLSKIGERFNQLTNSLAVSSFKWNQISHAIQNFSNTFDRLSKPGQEFQQKRADLSAITGIADKDLDELGRTAR